MRRRLAAALLIVLAVPALALASDKEPKTQLNPADQKKAASLLLRRTDFVSGLKKVPSTPDKGTHYSCPGYDPDGSDLVVTGDAEADFERTGGFPAVYSSGQVFKTPAHALAAWTRAVKPAAATCFAKLLREGIETEDGVTVQPGATGRIAFPKLAPRTAAFRAQMKVTVTDENGETSTVPLTMYVVALGQGRAEAGLMTIGFGNTTPLADVRTLAKVVAQRLAAAKL